MIGKRARAMLESLTTAPKLWKELRLSYYGEERSKSVASTRFSNQLAKMLMRGFIIKTDIDYKLTEEGLKALSEVKG